MAFWGGNDFRCIRITEDGLLAGKAKGHQVERSRYDLDLEGFWLGDKRRIVAVIATSASSSFPMIFSGI
jgi:hypothetical protein